MRTSGPPVSTHAHTCTLYTGLVTPHTKREKRRKRGKERQGNCTPCFAAAKTFFSQRHCACIMHAHVGEGEGRLCGRLLTRREFKILCRDNFSLTVLPVIFAKMTVARTVLVTVSCKNVGINEMIPFLSDAYRAPREFPEISRWPVRSAHTKSNDACKRCTKRAVINDECLDTILGTSRIDAFNVMSGNGRGVPII